MGGEGVRRAEYSITGSLVSGAMLDEFKRKDWGEEKNEVEEVGGRGERGKPSPFPHFSCLPPLPLLPVLSLPSLSFSMHPICCRIESTE